MTKDSFDPRVAEWLRREAPPAASPALAEQIVASTRAVPQRSRWTLWTHAVGAPAAASVAIVAVIATVALVLPSLLTPAPVGPSPSPSGSTAPTTPIASERVGPEPSGLPVPTSSADDPSEPGQAWVATALPNPAPNAFRGALPSDAVVGGPGLVVVGSATPCCAEVDHEDDPWQVGIWTSSDGLDWDLVPDLETFGRAGLRAIAADARTGLMLSVGYSVQPPAGEGSAGWSEEGTLWRSENGIDWTGVEGIEGVFYDVAHLPSGWIVAGAVDGTPTVFVSGDLASWTTTNLGGQGRVEHLAVHGDGRIVALGCRTQPDDPRCDPVTWISTDGDTWDEGSIDAMRIGNMTAWQDGFVAIASDEDGGTSRSWISTDGRTWEEGAAFDPAGASVATVVEVDGRLLAGGSAPGEDGTAQPRLWSSDDGVAWESLADPQATDGQVSGSVLTLIALPDRVIALGEAFIAGAEPFAWTSER